MDVAPDRRWSPRPLPPPVKPAPSASPAPEGQTLVPQEAPEAPDPVLLPLTGAFLLLVAGLLAHQARPIVGARLPLRR